MSKVAKVAYGLAVGWAVVAPAILWATAPAASHPSAAPKVISVCLTVTPKSAHVAIGGGAPVGVSFPGVGTTCAGV